jgi:tRNA pseudouridine38-40 synthase
VPLRTLKLTLAYDGTNYVGWQRQVNGLSIQEVVESAFAPLAGGAAPAIAGASRTDAGVHARGQVASVHTAVGLGVDAIQRALNVRLPAEIRVLDVADARPGFHARVHAIGKVYRYRIAIGSVVSPFDRWFVWHAPEARDVASMRQAAARLVGTHDFASFQASGSSIRRTVRTIHRLDVREEPGEIVVDVEGDGFLRHMVRAIAGTLIDVAAGTRSASSIPAILEAKDRRAAGPTAPAAGLTLLAVRYPAVC